jgi:hypothetical protein
VLLFAQQGVVKLRMAFRSFAFRFADSIDSAEVLSQNPKDHFHSRSVPCNHPVLVLSQRFLAGVPGPKLEMLLLLYYSPA